MLVLAVASVCGLAVGQTALTLGVGEGCDTRYRVPYSAEEVGASWELLACSCPNLGHQTLPQKNHSPRLATSYWLVMQAHVVGAAVLSPKRQLHRGGLCWSFASYFVALAKNDNHQCQRVGDLHVTTVARPAHAFCKVALTVYCYRPDSSWTSHAWPGLLVEPLILPH
jgi:hypothetical protein